MKQLGDNLRKYQRQKARDGKVNSIGFLVVGVSVVLQRQFGQIFLRWLLTAKWMIFTNIGRSRWVQNCIVEIHKGAWEQFYSSILYNEVIVECPGEVRMCTNSSIMSVTHYILRCLREMHQQLRWIQSDRVCTRKLEQNCKMSCSSGTVHHISPHKQSNIHSSIFPANAT